MDLIYIIIFAVYNMKKISFMLMCNAVLLLYFICLMLFYLSWYLNFFRLLFYIFFVSLLSFVVFFMPFFISVIVFISYFAAFVSLKFVSLSLATRVGLKMFQSPDSRPFHSSGHCVHQCTKEYIRNAVLNVACGFQSKPL